MLQRLNYPVSAGFRVEVEKLAHNGRAIGTQSSEIVVLLQTSII
jgi:hypothetical protein